MSRTSAPPSAAPSIAAAAIDELGGIEAAHVVRLEHRRSEHADDPSLSRVGERLELEARRPRARSYNSVMERKLATVLFIDLVDSTSIVTASDPEVVRRRV